VVLRLFTDNFALVLIPIFSFK